MIFFKRVLRTISNRSDRLQQKIIDLLINRIKTVNHRQKKMFFYAPNPLSRYRIRTFSTKEPDTLAWIDSMPRESVFWDGANIGLYSVYAAKARKCKVLAFEPSVFNLEFLAKNIYLNQMQEKILIFPIALSDKSGFNLFRMSNTVWGGALSTFGENYDQNGKFFNSVFEYTTSSVTMDSVVPLMSVTKPDYIKIDVDGIEHLILDGAKNILKTSQSVLIEIDENFTEQIQSCNQHLLQAGLVLEHKFSLGVGSNQYNQLWVRK
ncbi:MAG TPA: FkbM family methyltransferase [Candidatus Thioglobus sp.]|nr:FkbM family methyltransferase [Candidatus Thioglobus sp.]